MEFIVFHMVDDRSGSPRVLKECLKSLINDGHSIHIITSNTRYGFLHDLGCEIHSNSYRIEKNKILKTLFFIVAQIKMALIAFSFKNKKCIFYINTTLPLVPGIIGKLLKKKVIYHIHEAMYEKGIRYQIIKKVIKATSTSVIYVSRYIKKKLNFNASNETVIHNSITLVNSAKDLTSWRDKFIVLMPASYKASKGIFDFCQLAKTQRENGILYRLVLNASEKDIVVFRKTFSEIKNLEIYSRQKEMEKFYQEADIVINMSKVDNCVEAFGMTLIEAFSFGIPVIAPPAGGPIEIVDDRVNGHLVDPRELDYINKIITLHKTDEKMHKQMKSQAKIKSKLFEGKVIEVVYLEHINSIMLC